MAPSPLTIASNLAGFSPIAVHDINLAKREATRKIDPSAGAKDPRAYNNLWFQILFAFIGVGMVMVALWFFFWAKNGGFKWQENDWEDYKSTVLRRKGPDGKTLSNATKSTKLGGGSVVHGGSYGAPTSVGYTDETGTTVSEMREVEEGKGRRHFGIRGGDAEKKKKKKRHEHDNDYKDPELRAYRDERPARVGGLNRQADGMYTDYSATGTEPSELGSNVSARPLVKDKEKKADKEKVKEAKAKEQRAKERMRKAKLAEKEAAKTAAAEAKAQKEAEKAAAKKEKAEQKKAKKAKSEVAPSEIGGPAMTKYTALESEYTYEAPMTEHSAPSEAPAPAKSSSRRAPPSAAYSFTTGDDRTEYTGTYTDASKSRAAPSEAQESSYYSDYRPNAERSRASRSQSRPRQSQSRSRPSSQAPRSNSQSPRKHHRSSRTGPSNASDIFTAANGEPRGTIAYPCHIPGLSTAGSVSPYDSVSQAGAPRPPRTERGGRDVMAGYRRGGVRTVRRDSLSDSEA